MKYDFDQLDVSSFGGLTRALVEELTRTAIQAPSQTSTIEIQGQLLWPNDSGGELRDGPTLIVLYFTNSGSSSKRASALSNHVNSVLANELERNAAEPEGAEPDNGNNAPSNFPPNPFDYRDPNATPRPTPLRRMVFATNTTFQILPNDELADLKEQIAEAATELNLDGWEIWQGSDYMRMLDVAPRTRIRYLSSLVRTNMVDRIDEYNIGLGPKSAAAIKRLLVGDLQADQLVKLAHAGDPVHSGLPLDRIGIDLPLVDEKLRAAQFVIAAADRPSHDRSSTRPNILLLGGPGQGKSTIMQMIAQCYRIAMLKGSSGLGSSAVLMDSLEQGLQGAGIRLPRHLRFPIRIELSQYVEAAAGPKQTSIIKYITDLDRRRGSALMYKKKIFLKYIGNTYLMQYVLQLKIGFRA